MSHPPIPESVRRGAYAPDGASGSASEAPTASGTRVEKQDVRCPKCGEPLSFEIVAGLTGQSRVTMALHAMPGEYMSASVIGGKIKALGELLEASGRAMGVPTTSLVESVDTDADGKLTVRFLIARGPDVAARKKRMKKAAGHPAVPPSPKGEHNTPSHGGGT